MPPRRPTTYWPGAVIAVERCRVRAFPFGQEVRDFIDRHERIYVAEQNRDGQIRTLLINELDAPNHKLKSVLHYDGLPITARFICEQIEVDLADSDPATDSGASSASLTVNVAN